MVQASALQRLELRDNGLTAIEGLEALSSLTSLDLQARYMDSLPSLLSIQT